ncbi:cell division transport system ATP-binding protein [Humitalea rosea]|uniref:Cell division transport system ATP-binding protein n=1 Tax=Humitalea rosea TaxID=990373 RepID=A0A2W7HUP0_9PROT|nr:ATP-binding cassette domain-containing protein [Humitalea rosea]PZW37720.1 cell division transport system ATP-binding protein [Humitalea rosea]
MLRFTDVGLRYEGAALSAPEVLCDLDFTLAQGSFTWLLGPSGAGKSSLLRLMGLALRPSRGEVEVLGLRVGPNPSRMARRGAIASMRRRIATVYQDFRLLPYLSVADNVALPLRLAGRAEASLLPDVAEMLAWVGLDHRHADRPATLSGGEQQRAAIARAVVGRPDVLLADEPTGNLDAGQARRLLALLIEMHRLGTTVVVATHSEDLPARFPAAALVLGGGRARHVQG